jgi:hypothetical protein
MLDSTSATGPCIRMGDSASTTSSANGLVTSESVQLHLRTLQVGGKKSPTTRRLELAVCSEAKKFEVFGITLDLRLFGFV